MVQPIIFSHWYALIENFQHSSKEFYVMVENAVKNRQVPDFDVYRVSASEGGLFSARREYLRVTRREHIFDICAAPFGTGFFVSWWLGEKPAGCFAMLAGLPFIGFIFRWLIKPATYYRIDTALMFQQTIHNAVLEIIDTITKTKGIRALSESERKPILRDFYKR